MALSPTQLRLLTIAISLLVQGSVLCINKKDQLKVVRGGCGSHLATAHITSLGDRIRDNPSTLDDNGGAAALHNSVTNFGSSTHRCGATLISDRWLLTAAHCFNTERLSGISIGRDNLDKDPSPGVNTYEIEKVIIHPDYKPANYRYNDLALISSNSEIKYGTKVWPYCLPSRHLDIHDYMPVKIAGWGAVGQSRTSSPIVQVANLKIVENSRCDADWRSLASTIQYENLKNNSYPNGITKQVVCAGESGVDACSGDSGGPMTHQDRSGLYSVIGIVAFGIANCPKNPVLPGFYSNVQYYLDWIYSTTGLPRPTTTTNTQQNTPQPPGQQFTRFTTPDPCSSSQFQCPGGQCIRRTLLCDGYNDCPDGADEKDCNTCSSSQYQCPSGQCIRRTLLCDDYNDCPDGADEKDCNTCSSFQFQCPSGFCIRRTLLCDDYNDCPGGADEKDCIGALGAVGVSPVVQQGGFGQPQGGFGQPQGGFGQPQGGFGQQQSGPTCRRWCRTPQGQTYCCDIGHEPISAAVTKPGQCPPVRPSCPPSRDFVPPRQCSIVADCTGADKCCFDTCLQLHTCMPPIGLGKK